MLISGWEQGAVDTGKHESLYNVRCWVEKWDGRYEVRREESFAGFEMGMTIDDFQIAGIRHDVIESLISAVIALGPRFCRWKILSVSCQKVLVLLQLLIPLVAWSVVNVTADVNDFRLISLDASRVSREDMCLPWFDAYVCSATSNW